MRILVVSQYYFPENVVISSIARELVQRGHKVSVITGQPNYGFGKILEGYENLKVEDIDGVTVYRMPLSPRGKSKFSLIKNYLSFYRSSTRFIKHFKEEFDLVYSMSLSPLISVSAANIYAKKHHVPHYLHVLDLWPESPVATGAIRKCSLAYFGLYHWSRSIYKKANKILISSPSFENYFHDVLKMSNASIEFVPQPALIGKDADPFLYSEGFNLVYVGNVGSLQLIENVVKAIGLLPSTEGFYFHMIGDGSRIQEVLKLVNDLDLDEVVFYHGRKDNSEVSRYQLGADALLVSLKQESSPVSKTIPNKLISSLYFAKPILGCIKGDGRTILEAAKGSVLCNDDTPKEIAEGLSKLLKLSKEKRKVMGQNNAKYYEDNFDFSKVIDHLEQVFISVKKD